LISKYLRFAIPSSEFLLLVLAQHPAEYCWLLYVSRLFAEFPTNMAIANGERCKVELSFSEKKIFHGNLEQTDSKEPVSVPLPSARIIESSCILPLTMPILLTNHNSWQHCLSISI
jgi:hypothetical protein